MQSKPCTHCKAVKPLDDFNLCSNAPHGRQSWCKACLREKFKARVNKKYDRELLPGYLCWREMCSRCRNPKAKSYPDYGARGIKVCAEWQGRGGYERFIAHIGPRPTPKHQIDRKDNDGNYEPGNVQWVPKVVNIRNRRNTRRLTWNGETKSVAEWAEQDGAADCPTIRRRVSNGWTAEEAIFGKGVRQVG